MQRYEPAVPIDADRCLMLPRRDPTGFTKAMLQKHKSKRIQRAQQSVSGLEACESSLGVLYFCKP